MSLTQEILTHAKELHDYIVKMRRDFHKHPETGFEETRTSSVIAEEELDHETCGKWVVSGARSYIGQAFKKVEAVVRLHEIYSAKMIRSKKTKGRYFLLVYADERTKQSVLEKLEDVYIKPERWQANDSRVWHGGLPKLQLAF